MKNTGYRKAYAFILLFHVLFFFSGTISAQPAGCSDCSRTAVLGSTTLTDPMHLVNADAFRSSVFSRIAELVTTPCFHLGGADADSYTGSLRDAGNLPGYGTETKTPEYIFTSELVSGLNETGADGRPVRSKWTISLWFEGKQREMVHSWQTLGTQEKRPASPTERNTGTTFSGHGNMMSEQFRGSHGITEIIERFEKRPVECTVDPEYEEVGAGAMMEIRVKEFKDRYGQSPREFNRIVVHARNGEITNGEECDIGPDYRVFMIGDGTVRIQYQAPEETNENSEIITIYNACEILPKYKVPYSKTTIATRIAEKRMEITSNDAELTLTATRRKSRMTSSQGSYQVREGKDCRKSFSSHKEFLEESDVRVKISLKRSELSNVTQNPLIMTNQTLLAFTPVSAEISAFVYRLHESSEGREEVTGSDCRNNGSEGGSLRTRSVTGTPSFVYSPAIYIPASLQVIFDSKTGKALKFAFPDVDIKYSYHETREGWSRWWPTDSPPSSWTENEETETSLRVGPVEDPVHDPYSFELSYNPLLDTLAAMKKRARGEMAEQLMSMVMAQAEMAQAEMKMDARDVESSSTIRPDLLVTKGDGKSTFGGEGRKLTEKKLDNGTEREELTFSWLLVLTKK